MVYLGAAEDVGKLDARMFASQRVWENVRLLWELRKTLGISGDRETQNITCWLQEASASGRREGFFRSSGRRLEFMGRQETKTYESLRVRYSLGEREVDLGSSGRCLEFI